jgi:GNAT superfamily N-acetyltransferase
MGDDFLSPRPPQVREARASDAPSVARLASELGLASDVHEATRRLATIDADEGQTAMVAEVDGEVVGWVHVVESTSLQSGTLVEIRGLVVDTDARRSGVGRALVAAAETWAAARGHEVIRVRTDVRRDDARDFYLGVGYEERKRQLLLTRRLR